MIAQRTSNGQVVPPAVAVAPGPLLGRMTTERLLQINMATLVPLGALLLGMGEQVLDMEGRGMTLALVAFVASIASLFLTDVWGWIRLSQTMANLAALGATAFSVYRFPSLNVVELLVAVTNLLIYLQVVLLFQKKTVFRYWLLLVLSFLEVAVSTAPNRSILFGSLLVAYLFVALATMGLLFMLSESQRAVELASRQTRNGGKRLIQVLPALPDDLPEQLLGRGIVWRTCGIGIGTLIVAAVCFVSLPRFGRAIGGTGFGSATIGYSPDVTLGDMGPLLQDPSLVMRVDFHSQKSGIPIAPTEPPLLRGSLVVNYEHGKWSHQSSAKPQMKPVDEPPETDGLVLQHIAIEPLETPVLFCVYPPYEPNPRTPNQRIQFDENRQQLMRASGPTQDRFTFDSRRTQFDRFEYDLVTTGIWQGRQLRMIPQPTPVHESRRAQLLQMPDELPADATEAERQAVPELVRLTGLRATAAQKIRDAHLAADDHYQIAKMLEQYLSSAPFEYSLDRPPPQPGVDPIEDFVTRNRSGHCEYFASALTLMLRSQGIPARMVIGFRGGEWNSLGSFYDVRQLHAHAWVEAYLERGQKFPANEFPAELVPFENHGFWLVLDPTPAGQLGDADTAGSWLTSAQDFKAYLQKVWSTYIVGLNAERQDQAIYKPLAAVGEDLKQLWKDPKEAIASGFESLKQWLWGTDKSAGWLNWRVVVAVLILAASLLVAGLAARRAARWLWGRFERRRGQTFISRRSQINFYRRFETLLARRGLRRRAGQTQLEFARSAAVILNGSLGPQRAAGLTARLVETFYRVRFGHVPLDNAEVQAVERVLAELNIALKTRG